jgi:hypothetical protein
MNKKITQNVDAIEDARKSLKRGQAVLEIHVTKPRKQRNSPYIKADVTGTLTIKGHVFRHASGNTLAMIAYVCGIRKVKVFSPHAESDTTVLAAYPHPSAGRPWAHSSDEGRFLVRFNVTLVHASTSKRQPKKTVDGWEKYLPEAINAVPVDLRKNVKLDRGDYNADGSVMTPTDLLFRRNAEFMKNLFEQLGQDKGPVSVGNVTYLSREYMRSH